MILQSLSNTSRSLSAVVPSGPLCEAAPVSFGQELGAEMQNSLAKCSLSPSSHSSIDFSNSTPTASHQSFITGSGSLSRSSASSSRGVRPWLLRKSYSCLTSR